MKKPKQVVIVGAGFGGLNAAKVLRNQRGIRVVLIDRRNYHLFQPLLYQVASAALSSAEIAFPIRSIFRRASNVECLLGEVSGIDVSGRVVTADFGTRSYDYLVLACGATHSYFGHESWETFAPGLKTLEQAAEIRRRVLLAFEMAEREVDMQARRAWLTFVVIGGGPTGVELAGALGEITRFTLSRDFRRIDPGTARIVLVEGGSRILPSFHEGLSKRASRDLENLGVTIWTSSKVTDVNEAGIKVGAEVLEARTVIWAAGVKPSPLNAALGVSLDPLGRVIVERDLSIHGHPEVFVIGDAARFDIDGAPLPGIAPIAIQQGRHVASSILLDLMDRPREGFRYFDKGMIATIGKSLAVGTVRDVKLKGWLAWVTWLFVHIYYLIGFKNRLFVVLAWAWSYFTHRRGARLILEKNWRMFTPPED